MRSDWLRKAPPKRAFSILKAIGKSKVLISKGACYLVGNGASINVWLYSWVPWLPKFKTKPKSIETPQNPLMVSDLRNHELNYWNGTMLQELFELESAQAILSIPIPLSPKPGELIWVKDPKGVFSVKSTYRVE